MSTALNTIAFLRLHPHRSCANDKMFKIRSLFKELAGYEKRGVDILLDGLPASPMQIVQAPVSYTHLKVTGEKPGKELKSWSYSVKEVADLLEIDVHLVSDLLKKNHMEGVIVDYWKRIPKESFQNWYKSQSRYRTKAVSYTHLDVYKRQIPNRQFGYRR